MDDIEPMNMIEQESLELGGPHRYWMWATSVTMFVAGFVSILLGFPWWSAVLILVVAVAIWAAGERFLVSRWKGQLRQQ